MYKVSLSDKAERSVTISSIKVTWKDKGYGAGSTLSAISFNGLGIWTGSAVSSPVTIVTFTQPPANMVVAQGASPEISLTFMQQDLAEFVLQGIEVRFSDSLCVKTY